MQNFEPDRYIDEATTPNYVSNHSKNFYRMYVTDASITSTDDGFQSPQLRLMNSCRPLRRKKLNYSGKSIM